MKLDHECVRALLLYIEDHLDYGHHLYLNNLELKDFSKEDILYTALRLKEGGYINASVRPFDNISEITVSSITWDGHKLLDTIRDPAVWKHTKGFLSKCASASISFVENIASQVITNMLNQYLLQNPTP